MTTPPTTIVAGLLPCLLAACSTSATSEQTFRDSFTFSDSEKNLWVNAFVDRDQRFYLACSLQRPAPDQRELTRSYRLVYDVESPAHLSLSSAEDDEGTVLEITKYLTRRGTKSDSLATITVALPRHYLEDHRDTGFEVVLTGDRESEAAFAVSAAVIDGFLLRCDYEEERSEPRTRRRRRR